MNHRKFGRKLGRNSAHRRALFKNQLRSLVQHGRIETTHTKAKVLKRLADRLVTLGKKQSLHARRLAYAQLRSNELLARLFSEIAPQFAEREGGYTRILKSRRRHGDAAEMSIVDFVESKLHVAATGGSEPKSAE